MASLTDVIFFALLGGVVSLVGGFLLLSNKTRALTIAKYATPFAAGALLAAAFNDLLKEGAHGGDADKALTGALLGILAFFILERFLHWFHHHHEHKDKQTEANTSLIIVGDTVHNFIDGIAIGAAFLVNTPTGIVAALAVAAHEIPQEIGDFGLLLKKGMSRANVIKVNMLSALATLVAAVGFFQFGQDSDISLSLVLGLVAGFFIYIAVSDIIPSIHKNEEKVIAGPQTILLIVGVIVVSIITPLLHEYVDVGHEEETSSQSSEAHSHDSFEHASHDDLPVVYLELDEEEKSGWNLTINTENFTFSPENVNKDHVDNEGHAHLYVNDEKITRVYSNALYLDNLNEGDIIRVVLNTNDHREYTHDGLPIQASVTVGESNHDSVGDDHSR